MRHCYPEQGDELWVGGKTVSFIFVMLKVEGDFELGRGIIMYYF